MGEEKTITDRWCRCGWEGTHEDLWQIWISDRDYYIACPWCKCDEECMEDTCP